MRNTPYAARSAFLGVDVALRRLDFCLLERGDVGRWRLALARGVVARAAVTKDVLADAAPVAAELLERVAELAPPAGILAGIDAPLTLPAEGVWRACDRGLHRLRIPCYAPLSKSFAGVTHFGIALAHHLSAAGVECIEAYPYAARVRLDVAPRQKKQRPEGRSAIRAALARYVDLAGLPEDAPHDALDAVLAALTAALHADGLTEAVSGPDGAIIIPRAPAVP